VRHMIRQLVKLGHYEAFMASMAAWNVAAGQVGLPAYRIWDSQFGAAQEVFTEADYDSVEAHLAAFDGAHGDAEFAAANREVSTHLVDGSVIDYVLFDATQS
jgi:hypothetical protein